MFIIEIILMGVLATYYMDFLAGFLAKRRYIRPTVEPEMVGRWFLWMFKGRFRHVDIRKSPELSHEKRWCLISHYLIGIGLAGIYLVLEQLVPSLRSLPWMAFLFGISTTVLPWFWLFPSMGFGFMASKAPNRSQFIKNSIINHVNFGVGFFIWIVFIHPFFIMQG